MVRGGGRRRPWRSRPSCARARSPPQTAGCRQSGSWHQQRAPGQQCLQDRARRCAAELAQLARGVRGGGAYRSRRQRHAAAVRQQRDGATAARREAFACLKACGQPGRQAGTQAGRLAGRCGAHWRAWCLPAGRLRRRQGDHGGRQAHHKGDLGALRGGVCAAARHVALGLHGEDVALPRGVALREAQRLQTRGDVVAVVSGGGERRRRRCRWHRRAPGTPVAVPASRADPLSPHPAAAPTERLLLLKSSFSSSVAA